MCAKCKLQLGEHLINHQNTNSANKIDISEQLSLNKQCHHFQSEVTPVLINNFPFQEFNSQEFIELQNAIRENTKDAENLLKSDALKPSNEIFKLTMACANHYCTLQTNFWSYSSLLLNKNCGNCIYYFIIFLNF
jgi:hypothetical protein